jgi:hypothetical protein
MPTKEQEKQGLSQGAAGRQQHDNLIGKRVLAALGQPPELHRLYVRQLWEDRYRVNIVIGEDVASAKIVHSYFVVSDGAGNIVLSIPEIKKQY